MARGPGATTYRAGLGTAIRRRARARLPVGQAEVGEIEPGATTAMTTGSAPAGVALCPRPPGTTAHRQCPAAGSRARDRLGGGRLVVTVRSRVGHERPG